MKNSFYLIIRTQHENPERLKYFEPAALKQWLMDLPTANPGLATRLFHDFIQEFNSLKMDRQFRLDTMELLRPSFKTIEDYLISSIIDSAFPKVENELKIHQFLTAIQKEFTLGYWIAVKDLTVKNVSWFQSKSVAMAIQRVTKGLSELAISHYLLYLPVPEWVWMDLHSLNKLCSKIKKETVKVQDDTCLLKNSSPLDTYKHIILFALADPSGLQQKEILQVYRLSEHLINQIKIGTKPVPNQEKQCIILQDEDRPPSFFEPQRKTIGVAVLYIDISKLAKNLKPFNKFINKDIPRFSLMNDRDNPGEHLSLALVDYLKLKWSGQQYSGTPFFKDREKRLFCIGLTATYNIQNATELNPAKDPEYPADPSSDRFLNCKLNSPGLLNIGSLISFRKHNAKPNKRSIAVICNISQKKASGILNFAVQGIASQAHPVTYLRLNEHHTDPQKAMIFGQKIQGVERSFLIIESTVLNNFDLLRLFLNKENFPIILANKKNIAIGFWQFECRRIEEKDLP